MELEEDEMTLKKSEKCLCVDLSCVLGWYLGLWWVLRVSSTVPNVPPEGTARPDVRYRGVPRT